MLYHTQLLLQCVGLVHLSFPDFFPLIFLYHSAAACPDPEGRAEFTSFSPAERRDSPAGDRQRGVSSARRGRGKAAAVTWRCLGGQPAVPGVPRGTGISRPCPGGCLEGQPAVPGGAREFPEEQPGVPRAQPAVPRCSQAVALPQLPPLSRPSRPVPPPARARK